MPEDRVATDPKPRACTRLLKVKPYPLGVCAALLQKQQTAVHSRISQLPERIHKPVGLTKQETRSVLPDHVFRQTRQQSVSYPGYTQVHEEPLDYEVATNPASRGQ